MKTALITGINGQDGSYLAELLLEKGYDVYGIVKRNSVPESQTTRIEHLIDRLELLYADVTDISSVIAAVKSTQPDELYHLAAQSHVRISFDQPIYTAHASGLGALNVLEAVRIVKPDVRVYQASSSEMFGNSVDEDGFQRESTPMTPVSPYGCAKVFAYHLARNYRHSYGLYVTNGIMFDHESPRRGTNFVSNKICKEAVRVRLGLTDKLELGCLTARRDWGHAADYVRAMWLMMQQPDPDDFVCATGESRSVGQLVEYVFDKVGIDVEGTVFEAKRFLRPEELYHLKGDSAKLRNATGWAPKHSFESMLDDMVEHWMKTLGR